MALFTRGSKRSGVAPEQLRLLSRSSQIEEATPPILIRVTIAALSLGVLAAVALASVANINEIARTDGVVEPLGLERDIQHATGGFVAELHVREGERVAAGQPILTLSDTALEKDLARAAQRSQSLRVEMKILKAYLDENLAPLVGLSEADRATALATNAARRAAFEDQATVIREQQRQKTREIEVLRRKASQARRKLVVAEDLLSQRRQLWEKGHLTKVTLIAAEQAVLTLQSEIEVARTRIETAKSAEAEYVARIASLRSTDRSAAIQSYNGLAAQLGENEELVAKLEAQRAALVVRATVDGVLNGLKFASIGGLVRPATTITKIVPTGERMVVRARIKPKDIGRLRPGSAAQLRFQAYDFERYGAVPGVIDSISAASFIDEDGRLYYTARIAPERTYVGADSARNPIQVGMSVSAEIITGRRTVLQYLLQPIHTALSSAMTES